MIQSYTFSLKYDIVPGLVVSGRLLEDIKASVLVCFTTIGKVLLFQPSQPNPSFLNINREIKALSVMDIVGESSKLVMASENTLIAHDIDNNFDVFYKEIADGISVLCSGRMNKKDLIFVGGNCSIQGFDGKGEEVYWNVTSDDVSCIQQFGEQQEYLLVGSIDNCIRIYKNEEILYQIKTLTVPTSICGTIQNDQITVVYGLDNGSLCMAEQQIEKWTKLETDSIQKIIIESELVIVMRQIGKIELRQLINGNVVQIITLEEVISGLLYDDLRGIGQKQLIVVSKNGTVRGYTLIQKEDNQESLVQQITQLNERKQQLQSQLALYDNKQETINTKLLVGYIKNTVLKCVDLVLMAHDQNTYLTQTILFSDSLFKNGNVYQSSQPSYKMHIPLEFKDNLKAQIIAKSLISTNPYGSYFQILEHTFTLPKFANYFHVEQDLQIESYLDAAIKERIPRYVKWIDQCFILEEKIKKQFEQSTNEFTFNCQNIVDGTQLQIKFNSLQGFIQIRCDNITVIGQIIQDLCDFIQLQELNTTGSFPQEMSKFKEILKLVEQHRSSKFQLVGEVAEAMNNVKSLIVKAEDARMVGNVGGMKKLYANIMVQNKAIHSEILKKSQNSEILMKNLKEVNNMISKASELRVGSAKNNITTLCRQSIKNNNLYGLIEVIQQGKAF